MDTKICTDCGSNKVLTDFYKNKNQCKVCNNLRSNIWKKKVNYMPKKKKCNPKVTKKYYCTFMAKIELDGKYPITKIIGEAKRTDKVKGRLTDLSIDFVNDLISGACSYCGSYWKVGLDRIDNSVGHTNSNCVAACSQCNYMRRDIPYAAWKIMAEGVIKARSLGLFNNWQPKWGGRKCVEIGAL